MDTIVPLRPQSPKPLTAHNLRTHTDATSPLFKKLGLPDNVASSKATLEPSLHNEAVQQRANTIDVAEPLQNAYDAASFLRTFAREDSMHRAGGISSFSLAEQGDLPDVCKILSEVDDLSNFSDDKDSESDSEEGVASTQHEVELDLRTGAIRVWVTPHILEAVTRFVEDLAVLEEKISLRHRVEDLVVTYTNAALGTENNTLPPLFRFSFITPALNIALLQECSISNRSHPGGTVVPGEHDNKLTGASLFVMHAEDLKVFGIHELLLDPESSKKGYSTSFQVESPEVHISVRRAPGQFTPDPHIFVAPSIPSVVGQPKFDFNLKDNKRWGIFHVPVFFGRLENLRLRVADSNFNSIINAGRRLSINFGVERSKFAGGTELTEVLSGIIVSWKRSAVTIENCRTANSAALAKSFLCELSRYSREDLQNMINSQFQTAMKRAPSTLRYRLDKDPTRQLLLHIIYAMGRPGHTLPSAYEVEVIGGANRVELPIWYNAKDNMNALTMMLNCVLTGKTRYDPITHSLLHYPNISQFGEFPLDAVLRCIVEDTKFTLYGAGLTELGWWASTPKSVLSSALTWPGTLQHAQDELDDGILEVGTNTCMYIPDIEFSVDPPFVKAAVDAANSLQLISHLISEIQRCAEVVSRRRHAGRSKADKKKKSASTEFVPPSVQMPTRLDEGTQARSPSQPPRVDSASPSPGARSRRKTILGHRTRRESFTSAASVRALHGSRVCFVDPEPVVNNFNMQFVINLENFNGKITTPEGTLTASIESFKTAIWGAGSQTIAKSNVSASSNLDELSAIASVKDIHFAAMFPWKSENPSRFQSKKVRLNDKARRLRDGISFGIHDQALVKLSFDAQSDSTCVTALVNSFDIKVKDTLENGEPLFKLILGWLDSIKVSNKALKPEPIKPRAFVFIARMRDLCLLMTPLPLDEVDLENTSNIN